MAERRRRAFRPEERRELWRRWKRGESLSAIARALDRKPATVHGFVSMAGGIAPPPRKRSAQALTLEEREEISRGLSAGLSARAIARELGRSPSTISREISRNGGRVRYRAATADKRAWEQGLRPKRCKLDKNRRLRRTVARKLRQEWSPEQISGWLRTHSDDPRMNISHESIYRTLYVQTRGVLKKKLQRHLRTRRRMRRSRLSNQSMQGRGQIVDATPISERPTEVDDRASPGHWEGDLIAGSGNSHVATLVERTSRFTVLVKVDGKDADSVLKGLVRQMRKVPSDLRRTLTWDRGTEMAKHKDFRDATSMRVFFCDPQSPWQRGTNENTNRLLRQYLPKGTDLSAHSQDQLSRIARRLNTRPRKTLGFRSPADRFSAALR